jgi:BioD-like phosphotransacetylase family protein
MRTILVTATEESTGKTAVALALALLARERGLEVGYMKPKGTRLRSAVGKTRDEDPLLARQLLDLDAEVHDLEPVVYSPTFVEEAIRGREDPAELRERVLEAFDGLSSDRDLMLVEGGGTMSTGGVVDLTDADVADLLDARPLVLSGFEDARDVDAVLHAADHVGDDLLGVLFNAVGDSVSDRVEGDVAGFLERRDIPVLGVIPREADLAGVSVGALADELGADVVTSGVSTDATVERFSVGAMGAEEALRYFRRTTDAAVITGGDRSDVQTAALEAPGIRALVLTGGQRPSPAVIGTAEEEGVPVLLVSADTLTTVERAEEIVRTGRTQEAATVHRMVDLLEAHADVDALLDGEKPPDPGEEAG